jgi:hypothetical protein
MLRIGAATYALMIQPGVLGMRNGPIRMVERGSSSWGPGHPRLDNKTEYTHNKV